MGFLQRISSSLFFPKDVIKYRDDKWWLTSLIFIVYLMLAIIPFGISIFQSQELSFESRQEIRSHFNNKEHIPFYIENGKLVHNNNDQNYVYQEEINKNFVIIMTVNGEVDEALLEKNTAIILEEQGVTIKHSVVNQYFGYQEYLTLEGIDFRNASEYTNHEFWDQIFSVANQEFLELKPFLNVVEFSVRTTSHAIELLAITLIFAVFQSFTLSKVIKFTKIWKICIYLLAPYIFGRLLAILFGFGLLYYIGFIATAVYVVIATQTILKEKIRRD